MHARYKRPRDIAIATHESFSTSASINRHRAARELSVRETEALVQRLLRAPAQRRRKRSDRDLERLAEELSERLGTTVEIRPSRKGRGKLLLHYSSLDHLEQLLKRLK